MKVRGTIYHPHLTPLPSRERNSVCFLIFVLCISQSFMPVSEASGCPSVPKSELFFIFSRISFFMLPVLGMNCACDVREVEREMCRVFGIFVAEFPDDNGTLTHVLSAVSGCLDRKS